MKRIMSLDLGITTGWAIGWINPYAGILFISKWGTLTYEEENQFEADLTRLMLEHLPQGFVVEEPVIMPGNLGRDLQFVIAATRRVARQAAMWIKPSDWKDSALGKRSPLPPEMRGTTPHEKDAYRMLRWYLNTAKGVDTVA